MRQFLVTVCLMFLFIVYSYTYKHQYYAEVLQHLEMRIQVDVQRETNDLVRNLGCQSFWRNIYNT